MHMKDSEIVSLYLQRDESAIEKTKMKYSRYIYSIVNGILNNKEDTEECENDTYLAAWNCIPPHKPASLAPFLGKIARRIAINKWKSNRADKRGGGEVALSLNELNDCIWSSDNDESNITAEELSRVIDAFLRTLPETERNVFMRRYWYMDPINDICERYGFTQGKVKMMLMRTRKKLKNTLEKEKIFL